jgi:anti-anti-sigma factor
VGNDGFDESPTVVWVQADASEPLLVIQGELDADPHDVIRSANATAAVRAPAVLLDLTGVTFLGSAGLVVFIPAGQRLHADGKRLVIDAASPSCGESWR